VGQLTHRRVSFSAESTAIEQLPASAIEAGDNNFNDKLQQAFSNPLKQKAEAGDSIVED
jgi:hypothetical protein